MKNRVREAFEVIKENNWFDYLRNCLTISERYKKLVKILPRIVSWDVISARQLVFFLQRKHSIKFGVCPFFTMDDKKQYCTINGTKIECLCRISEPHCILRDKKKKQKTINSVNRKGVV